MTSSANPLQALTEGIAVPHSLYSRKELQLNEVDVMHFSQLVNNRERDRVLMDPRIRRSLRKLIAMRMWIGNRNISAVNPNDLHNDEPYRPVPGPADLVPKLTKNEKDLYYAMWFRGGPLYIDITEGPRDEIEVDGFIVPASGRPGPAEACGKTTVLTTVLTWT